MEPNLKYVDSNGNMISTYPAIVMLVTQNPFNSYSHAGAYSIDNASNGSKKLYAPVDMICVKNNGPGGMTYFHTVEPAMTPSGLKHYTLGLIHDNNANDWQVGTTYPQGTHIYTEGDAGYVTGVHAHIDVADGHVTTQYLNSYDVWCLTNQVSPDTIFYRDKTALIQMNQPNTDGKTMVWKKHGGGLTPDPSPSERKGLPIYLMARPFRKR